MIRPCPRAIAVAATLTVLCLLCETMTSLGDLGAALGWAVLVAVILANVVDIALALRLRIAPPIRGLPTQLIAGQHHSVPVTVTNPYGFSLWFDFSEHPARSGTRALPLQGLPRSLKIRGRHRASFEYQLQPLYRGALALGECELQVSGPLGLWQVRHRFTLPQHAQVGPNADALERLTFEHSPPAAHIGHPGRPWVAAPLTLIVWLDTGPALQAGTAQGRLWDHATDATVALAFAALRKGRPIGLHLNAGMGLRHVVPSAGENQLPELQRMLSGVQPGGQAVDFVAETARLMAHTSASTMIILITRLPGNVEALQTPLRQLAQEHRLLVVDVMDDAVAKARRTPVRIEAQAFGYCRAIQAFSIHQQAAYPLISEGLNVVRTTGNNLAGVVVEHYANALG